MNIGILGAAAVGQALATRFAVAGHDVILANSRGPDSLRDLVAGLGARVNAGSVGSAAAVPVTVLAVPWIKVAEVLPPLGDWGGRILIDATNIFTSYAPKFEVADLGAETGSEVVARLARGARVVKAFNTLPMTRMFAELPAAALRRVLFIAGDDQPAKQAVSGLIDDIGLAPVDLGPLAEAGRLMQLGGPLSGLELMKRAEPGT